MSLQVVDGKLMNSREIGNAVAVMLLNGTPIDRICEIEGMPTATQIAYMRKYDGAFAEAMQTAFEGGGIESALVLMKGARDGKIDRNQLEAAKWVAERMAPDLFQERKTITSEERLLTDEELAFQLQAAARSDERVRRLLAGNGQMLDDITHVDGTDSRAEEQDRLTRVEELTRNKSAMKQLRKIVARRREKSKSPKIKDITPKE